jgi:hypothetical protein
VIRAASLLFALVSLGCGPNCWEEVQTFHDEAVVEPALACSGSCELSLCRARCPTFRNAGGTTVSVDVVACTIQRAGTLSCDYRTIYDSCI